MDFALIGLAAGAAGWKAGHASIRSGALVPARIYPAYRDLGAGPLPEMEPEIVAYAAREARAYMQRIVEAQALTPAQGVRIFSAYWGAFIHGVLDEATERRAN